MTDPRLYGPPVLFPVGVARRSVVHGVAGRQSDRVRTVIRPSPSLQYSIQPSEPSNKRSVHTATIQPHISKPLCSHALPAFLCPRPPGRLCLFLHAPYPSCRSPRLDCRLRGEEYHRGTSPSSALIMYRPIQHRNKPHCRPQSMGLPLSVSPPYFATPHSPSPFFNILTSSPLI